MAREATLQISLTINSSHLSYQSRPVTFTADVAGAKGPSPGSITVSTVGTDVNLSELTTPALCRIMNLDTVNFVEYGMWDPQTLTFYPLGEILPGESYVLRLSRNLHQEYGTGPGTGTTGPETNKLRIRASGAPANVVVEAFEA